MQPDTREPTLLSKRIDGWIQQIAEGRIHDACEEIEKILKDGEEPSSAGVINDLGNHFWDQKDADVAIELLNRALHLADHSGRVALQATVLGNIGNIYYAKGSYDRALSHFERAATLYAKSGDSTWYLMMRISVGNALDEMTETEKACAQYRETAALAKSLGALPQQALALGNLGNVFGKRGEFREARANHAQALELAWQAEEPALVGKLAHDLSLDLRSLEDPGAADAETLATKALHAWTKGRHSLARAGLDAAILLLDEASAPMQLADYLDCAGQFDLAASDVSAATEAARRAVALARRHGDDRRTTGFLLNLSAIHLAAGELGDALDTANESFTLAKKSNHGATAVRALGNLGIVSQKQGQFSRAENYLRRQHDLALETNDGPQAASAANALGALFLELGSDEQSAALLDEARQLADKHGLASLAVSCLINLAILEGRKRDGDRDAQEAMYRRAIALSIELDNADTHVDAAINLVRLLLTKGDVDDAIRLLGATEDLAEQLGDPQKRAALTMLRAEAALNQGRLDDAREEFEAAGVAFSEISPAQSADCYVEAASIEYRQLLEAERSSPKPLEPEDRDLLLEQIFRKLVLPLSTYEGIARRLEDYRLWSLMQRQEKGFRLYADVCLKLFGPRSALAVVERSRARALRFAMYRRLAGQRTSAFHYAQAIRDQVFQVVTDLPWSTSNLAALTPDTFEALTRSVDRKDPQVQYYLSEEQLDQVVRSVGATVVEFAFSTQGSLHVWVMNGGTVHFVELNLDAVGGVAGLRETISQLRVSIGLTRDLGAGLSRPGTESRALLERLYSLLVHPIESWLPEKVGDPVCLVPDGPLFEVPFAALQAADGRAVLDRWAVFELPAIHFLAVSPEEPGTGFVVVGDATTPPAAEKEFGPIARLPFARDEALEVARLYGVTALIDSNATKDKVDPAWESAELVHIATHAILSPTRPFDSAIVLAAPPEGDAFIRVRDIDTKTLQSRLVVLSCCSTGGGVVTGDGVLSLCRGLLAAGAHSVIASLWAVSDESTRFTMIDFHQRLAENPFQNTLAGMFRESLLATRAKYPHHSQWAPFVLWGWPHWVQGPNWAHRDHAILGKPAPP